MTPLRLFTAAAMLFACAAAALAQADGAKPVAPAAGASAPHKSMHQGKMHGAKADADCKAMMDKQHKNMPEPTGKMGDKASGDGRHGCDAMK